MTLIKEVQAVSRHVVWDHGDLRGEALPSHSRVIPRAAYSKVSTDTKGENGKRLPSSHHTASVPYSCLRIGYKDWGDNKTRHPSHTTFCPGSYRF